MNQELLDAFRQETRDILDETEQLLLTSLESGGESIDVDEVFRALHTVKGTGSMFDLQELVGAAHRLESVFAKIRSGEGEFSEAIASKTLEGIDLLRYLADDPANTLTPEGASLLKGLEEAVGGIGESETQQSRTPDAGGQPDRSHDSGGGRMLLVAFAPNRELFENGGRPLAVVRRLASFGTYAATTRVTDSLRRLEELEPTSCETAFWFIVHTEEELARVEEAFIFVRDEAEVRIETIIDGCRAPSQEQWSAIRKVLSEDTEAFLLEVGKIIGRHQEEGLAPAESVESVSEEEQRAVLTAEAAMEESSEPGKDDALHSATLRVKYESLQEMINQVGEIVTLQARIDNYVAQTEQRDLQTLLRRLRANITELRDTAMQMRMVPLQTGLQHLRRAVYQAARETGKAVAFDLDTGDTELDKVVVDALKDPLLHIVRNSVDHGIETPEERVAAGKPEKGSVRITAHHDRGSVIIKVADDGAGIDSEAIRAAAIEKGVIHGSRELSEGELQNLIFSPGFSSRREATDLSGRGVGMDVVKRNIEALRGTVSLSSTPGEGTELLLELPLTLAIIDGLLFKVAGSSYLIDLSIVEECLQLKESDLRGGEGSRIIRIRDEAVPYLPVSALFSGNLEAQEVNGSRQAIVTRSGSGKLALLVDEITGQHQAAIKSLGVYMGEIGEFAGSTVLGDGTVAFVLDPQAVFRKSKELL
ncbi:MAG: chemotaxis protein CheA [Spirochaetaceae bacterium]